MTETHADPAFATGATPPEPAAPVVPERRIPIEFNASGAEYFRIWIVNLLLTIVTIGIYSAWAKVRRLRYFYGSTSLDGAAFEYHGQPLAILKGRLITFGVYAVFVVLSQFVPLLALVLLPVIVFGLPWILVRARLFQMRMSSYRGLRFNFHGDYGGAMGAYIGWGILAVITLYLLLPLWLWKRVNWLLGNASYGGERFEFTATRGRFFAFVYASVLFGVVIAFFGVVIVGATGALSGLGRSADGDVGVAQVLSYLPTITVAIMASLLVLLVFAYFQKSLLNASFGQLRIGPHRLESSLHTFPLFGVYASNLILIVLTLGLYYPWAAVKQMRYQLTNLTLVAQGDLDQFRGSADSSTEALGEEVSDFFDVDFGL